MSTITLAFCVYSAIFIYNTSFIVGDTRYFALFDDAMVSMRYAKNLVSGYGLIWNPGGAYVEGFTNPLWVMVMALAHLLPITAPHISLAIQVLAALLLLANLFVCKAIADLVSDGSAFVALSATTFIAFYLPLDNWSLQGMEVSIATLFLSSAILLALRSIRSGQLPYALYLLLALLTTIRLDLVIPSAVIAGFLLMAQKRQRTKHIFGLLFVIAAILAQMALRLRYYGDILPNTYYLKMTGYPAFLRITRGLYVTADFLLKTNLILFVVPLVALAIKRSRPLWLLFALVTAQLLYSIYVGGDAWEWWGGSNRYVSIVIPAFFILFAYGLDLGRKLALGSFPQQARVVNGLSAVAALVCLLNFNATRGADSWGEWLLLARPIHIVENERQVEQALLIDQITSDRATVAVVAAGGLPYFANRYMIDMLGKNDTSIAHAPMRTRWDSERFTYFYPGHLKWNYAYSIGELRPDVVVELWMIPTEAQPYLRDRYKDVTVQGHHLYLRADSPNIKWDLVRAMR